jgi:Zn-dependent peptidase ImmA (M78 family)/DNA-binding XRE family transcriptional regulator
MKTTVAKRIKSARTLAGFSLRELSHKMDGLISYNAISKYEKGLMLPDSKVMIQLAKALEVKVDYFFLPYNVKIDNIEFRKKSKLSVKREKAIKEKVTDAISRYIQLEEFLNVSYAFENPIQKLIIKDGNDVENAVNLLLEKWDLGTNALPNVIDLLEDKEIKIIEIEADEHFDGFSGWANNQIPLIIINKKSFSVERKRFTALHELGHLVLNFSKDLAHKDIERLCLRFAGAMLMPKATFLTEMGTARNRVGISELTAIKETYGISIQAVMHRAKDLGIVNQQRYVQFRRWINANGRRKKEEGLGKYIGREESNRFKQLLHRAAAEDIISMSKAANLANVKLAVFRDEFFAV